MARKHHDEQGADRGQGKGVADIRLAATKAREQWRQDKGKAVRTRLKKGGKEKQCHEIGAAHCGLLLIGVGDVDLRLSSRRAARLTAAMMMAMPQRFPVVSVSPSNR